MNQKNSRKTVSKKSSSGMNPFRILRESMQNDTLIFSIGAIICTIGLFIIIACVSFLFHGGADQSALGAAATEGIEIANSTGRSGASLSQTLINGWFGLPSFLMFVFLCLLGTNLMKLTHFRLLHIFISSTFLTVWLSLFLEALFAPLFRTSFIIPGGAHGQIMTEWLSERVGMPGIILILVVTMLIYLVWMTHNTIDVIRNSVGRVKQGFRSSKPEASATDTDENTTDAVPENVHDELPSETPANFGNFEDEDQDYVNNDPTDNGAYQGTDFNFKAKDVVSLPEKEKDNDSVVQESDTPGDDDKPVHFEIASSTVEEQYDENEIPEPYDPRLDLSHYRFPSSDLLKQFDDLGPTADKDEQLQNQNRIRQVLHSFGIEITHITATIGPTVTLYEITPAEGVRISKIRNLEDDIALSLAALGIRIIAPIPGKGTIGIEVPNAKPVVVPMKPIITSRKFVDTNMELPIALGRTITNEIYMLDLVKLPHLLVAGATGQGKSVGLNAIIASLLYKKHPAELKFVLIDPKMVEFSIYAPIEKHFLAKMPDESEAIITDVQKVVYTLKSLCTEMDNRYELLKNANVRAIKEYNDMFKERKLNPLKGHRFLPYIVVVIDEFADLIMTAGKDIEMPIARIAQKARAVGIHMIIATQRPTTTIITGNIKANFPARMAFRVTSMIDSRTILDRPGANQLIGRGDMLVIAGNDPVRVQCAFVDTPEVRNICDFISRQQGYLTAYELPEYVDENSADSMDGGGIKRSDLDPLFEEVARMIVANQQGSTSLIQRKFSIGFNRAGRIMDQLERAGVVGPAEGSKPRQVLCLDDTELENKIANLS